MNRDDAGVYECQATTHPPQAIFVRLKVVGKLLFLVPIQIIFSNTLGSTKYNIRQVAI